VEKSKSKLTKLVVGLGIVLFVGCAPKKKNTSDNPTPSVPEEAYCLTVRSIADGVTLTGSAEYQYLKPVYPTGLTLDSVGNVPFLGKIRHAEVRVKDSGGAIIQCGKTDNAGNYSVVVDRPGGSAIYTVEVASRGDNTSIKASILDKTSTKKPYVISATKTVSSTDTSVVVDNMVAPATVTSGSLFTKIEGGAFNIFDEILNVNEFLRSNTTNSTCGATCTAFTVAPKVIVYWTKGFNPASYLGETSGLSFFDASASIDSTASLYILGGANGDVDSSDTDHFDDSVIIHEYGHFLEYTYWRTNSPGGFHNGNLIIDPRLAFSEGFANFLPAAVSSTSSYIDTIGSPYGTRQIGVYLDLENETGQYIRDKIITTSPVGEGIYREVSVSRALYDYIDSASDSTYSSATTQAAETAQFSFAYIWLALTNASFGLKATDQHFVSMGHFNAALNTAISTVYGSGAAEMTQFDSARLGEFQTKDRSEYAQVITASTGPCVRTITPVMNRLISSAPSVPDESYYYHDLFASSDFYQITHSGGVLQIELAYTPSNAASPPDLDLYVYREAHSISDNADLVAVSDKYRADEKPSSGNESISINLAAGTYMVLISAATSSQYSGGSASYTLTTGGQSLCNAQ
jgi:hypothetical protein